MGPKHTVPKFTVRKCRKYPLTSTERLGLITCLEMYRSLGRWLKHDQTPSALLCFALLSTTDSLRAGASAGQDVARARGGPSFPNWWGRASLPFPLRSSSIAIASYSHASAWTGRRRACRLRVPYLEYDGAALSGSGRRSRFMVGASDGYNRFGNTQERGQERGWSG